MVNKDKKLDHSVALEIALKNNENLKINVIIIFLYFHIKILSFYIKILSF